MSDKISITLLTLIALVVIGGVSFLFFWDLDQTFTFPLPAGEPQVILTDAIVSPHTMFVVNGGVDEFFKQPIRYAIIGRGADRGSVGLTLSTELTLVGFGLESGRTYSAKQELGWWLQEIDSIALQDNALVVTLGKNWGWVSAFCVIIIFVFGTLFLFVLVQF